MANTKSAEKRYRQSEQQRARNRSHRARMRSAIKDLRAAVTAGQGEQARTLLPKTVRIIDMTATKGIIHGNTASRYKSRLAKAVAALG